MPRLNFKMKFSSLTGKWSKSNLGVKTFGKKIPIKKNKAENFPALDFGIRS